MTATVVPRMALKVSNVHTALIAAVAYILKIACTKQIYAMLIQAAAFCNAFASPVTCIKTSPPHFVPLLPPAAHRTAFARQQCSQLTQSVVDWFLLNMPATYFKQTTQEVRLEHLQAIR